MSELDHNLYTVSWIAPLYIEAKAALLMLDQKHHGRFVVSRGDDYVFHAGSMCGHNVVIATLPAGQEYGTGSAAALASQLRKSFPNLWFGLLVGVAAGLPNLSRQPPRDIRLGDVLVALPDGDTAGLVAYDLGKDTGDDGFQPLRLGHVLAQTETIVRSAIGKLRLKAPNDAESFMSHYQLIQFEEHDDGDFKDPGQDQDILYEFDRDGTECKVTRESRSDRERTRVWYGPIGSGEKLMRNSQQRNELRDKYNIIGLEMEAAGTMNRIPVGVIRGVCDYADEHKNKKWQPYAAAMAAAYGKAVLREILPDRQDELLFSHLGEDWEQRRLCQLWEKSVIIWKRTLGESHRHTLEAKVNLGITYSKLQEFTKAFDQQESVLFCRKREYRRNGSSETKGAHALPYLLSIGRLASLFNKTGQLSEAWKLRLRAARLAQYHFGLHDPITFTAFNKLLNCEASLGHITSEELIQKRQKLLRDQRRFLNPVATQTHPQPEIHSSTFETMSCLAVDLETAGYEAMAIELRKELLLAQKISLGLENRETLGNMRRLARILTSKPSSSLIEVQEGIKLLEEIEAVQQKSLGPDSFQVRDTRMETFSHKISSTLRNINPNSKDELDSEDDEAFESILEDFLESTRRDDYLSRLLKRKVDYSDSSGHDFSGESGSEED
ncbi:pfs domain-containing protein [Colletotrichum kahawae]|uniref:Pfs domain-containing protein n=1 Tax=Colletotrichum kahawae TaxID=34407 RepID=A0AAE0D6V4_COLKA|nr:pfs domain-containing protein [Colletotrichum kahawae]